MASISGAGGSAATDAGAGAGAGAGAKARAGTDAWSLRTNPWTIACLPSSVVEVLGCAAVAAASVAVPLSLSGESGGRDAAAAAASVLVRAQADAAAAVHHLRLDDVPEATRDLRAALALLRDAFPHLCDGA